MAARLVSGTIPIHVQLEEELAEFCGMAAAVVFSSGYMANLGALTALCRPRSFLTLLAQRSRGRALVVTESVFSVDGDVAPMAELLNVCRSHGAPLIVDDAHGLGVIGTGGHGASAAAGLAGQPDVVVTGTLGKSLGSQGGFVQFVSFLTDYGSDDGFVATCHGVLLDIVPQVRIIDVSHAIPPQDIQKGARLLARVTPYLPVGVYVAVVDPGVGGARKAVAVAVETARGIFVGPDNGLLSRAVDNAGGPVTSYELTNSRLFRSPVSRTFHGRDIFMPVAGHLAAGLALPEVGPELDPGSLVRLPNPVDRVTETGLASEVILVDNFGNMHLASSSDQLAYLSITLGDDVRCVTPAGKWVAKYVEVFDDAKAGELVVYVDAVGQLTLAVSSGNAARLLGVTPGMVVNIGVGF